MTAEPPVAAAAPGRSFLPAGPVLLAAAAVALAWLWVCWCVFPGSSWNDLRLAPTLALARGQPVYAGPTVGRADTWIYGPLPLLTMLPAAGAPSASRALLIAGALNLAISLAALGAVGAWWPAPAGQRLDARARLLAVILTIVLWPRATFQFLQADNLAVALGLLGNLVLIRGRTRGHRWGAAFLAVAPLLCKQTSVGVAAAQLAWLWLVEGRREAGRHGLRCALVLAALTGLAAAAFGGANLWFNLVELPAHIPWVPNPLQRIGPMAPELVAQLVVPAALMAGFRGAFWNRRSVLLLPALTWVCAAPASVAALLKLGGTINSIQSFPLWLTPTLLAALAGAETSSLFRRSATFIAAAAAVVIGGLRLAQKNTTAWRPVTAQYRQANYLARTFPGQIWFPCNPLVTILSDGRFDHDEDGLFVHTIAGHPLTLGHVYADLPPQLCVIALPRGVYTWGIAQRIGPSAKKRDVFGDWILYSWPPGPPEGTAPSSHG